MKKLLVLAILMVAVVLSATPNWSWVVEPTQLSFSMYDYMNGAYDGYPIRIQPEGIENRGIYMTYMANQSAAVPRRQRYAFVNFDGAVEAEDTITSVAASEGFGTLAIDPVSGNPFFVWHSAYSQSTFQGWFTYDIFSFSNTPGTAMADHAVAISNDPNETNHEYIWPVVHIGPSPEAGKRRVYVFSSNSGNAVQGTPSSSITLAYADFDTDDIEMGSPADIVWVQQRLPYFIDIHNWSPSDPDDNFARAFPSYAVSGDGKVALAGFISGNTTEWSGMEEHDTFVVISEDYGQNFTVVGLNLERSLDPGVLPQAEHNGSIIHPYFGNEVTQIGMRSGTLNHKTLAFDNAGRLHFPATFFISWPDAEDSSQYYWIPVAHTVTNVIYDHSTQTNQFYQMYPRAEEALTDELLMAWDLNNDGMIDSFEPVQDTDNTWYAVDWFTSNWPTFHHNTSNNFHYNQIRMSQFNEQGMAVMMWMDGTKAYRYNVDNNEDYAEFATSPEIKIVATRSNGNEWTEPITLNSIDFPELGTVPSYIYPADKVIAIDNNTVRVYFMYVDDLAYGASTQNEGANLGANIRFAAIDIDLSGTNVKDNVATVRPLSMLGQNYPNPFNPTTNIKFNIPSASNVNLSVYNVKGQLVKTLVAGSLTAGEHTVTWNGVDNNNNSVASGVYFYRLEANGQSEMRKMLLMK